jgi:hypothetical protein
MFAAAVARASNPRRRANSRIGGAFLLGRGTLPYRQLRRERLSGGGGWLPRENCTHDAPGATGRDTTWGPSDHVGCSANASSWGGAIGPSYQRHWRAPGFASFLQGKKLSRTGQVSAASIGASSDTGSDWLWYPGCRRISDVWPRTTAGHFGWQRCR